MPEFKAEGAEFKRRRAFLIRSCLFSRRMPVFPVAGKGTAQVRHLYPDLMVAAGVKMNFDKRRRGIVPGYCLYHTVVKPGRLCSGSRSRADPGSVGASVFDQVVFQCAFRRIRYAVDDSAVVFSEIRACELAIQIFAAAAVFAKTRRPSTGWSSRWITAR